MLRSTLNLLQKIFRALLHTEKESISFVDSDSTPVTCIVNLKDCACAFSNRTVEPIHLTCIVAMFRRKRKIF